MEENGDGFVLSTGKKIYANNGIIGLSPYSDGEDDERWTVAEGYDGTIDHEALTKAEQHELADYMIALWNEFKTDI